MSAEQDLQKLSQAIKGINGGLGRMTVSANKGAQSLISMIKLQERFMKNAKALNDSVQSAKEHTGSLGKTMATTSKETKDLGKATGDAANKVTDFGDALKKEREAAKKAAKEEADQEKKKAERMRLALAIPNFAAKKAQEEGGLTGMAGGMFAGKLAELAAAANPVTLVIAGLAGAVAGLIYGAKKSLDTFKAMSNSLGGIVMTMDEAADITYTANTAMARMGVQVKDTMSTLGALGDSLALNVESKARMSTDALVESAASFVRLAQASGMSIEESNKLAISLTATGTTINQLPGAFMRFKKATVDAATGLSPKLLAQTLSNIAPVSMLVTKAGDKFIDLLERARGGFAAMSDTLLKGLTAEQKGQAWARTATGLSQAMAGFGQSIPMMMAFGGGGAAAGGNKFNAWDMMQRGSRADVGKSMMGYLNMAYEKAGGGGAGRTAMAMGLQGLGVQGGVSALVPLVNSLADMRKMSAKDRKAQEDKMAEQLVKATELNTNLADPLERIFGVITAIFTWAQKTFVGNAVTRWMGIGSAEVNTTGLPARSTGMGM